MSIWGFVVLAIYSLALLYIFIFSLAQGHLTFLYLRSKKQPGFSLPELPDELPHVTIQLPVFNELYVVERLLLKVAEIDYPSDKLEIQVLDDSTDESFEVAARVIGSLKDEGHDIQHIKREKREGFKAGALQYGMERCKGKFIVIFDADFLPEKDFIYKTLPYFQDENLGMVQTRWEHLNKNYNLLTRLFSIGLDGHFRIEQRARNSNGKFMNFNGTAGMWRRRCIEDAGGWSADTLTEDFDLSYRAQLKGWKMKYMENYSAPAEIPAFIQAIRSQQYRWNKGGAEIARKNFKTLIKADIPLHVKVHALFHVMNTGVFLAIFIAAILSVPLLMHLAGATFNEDLLMYTWLFLLGFFIIAGFYWVTIRQRGRSGFRTTLQFLVYFPVFLSLSMGLSLFNAIAVSEGYLGIRSPFVRTPKFDIVGEKGGAKGNRYLKSKIPLIAFFEAVLACYFVYAIYLGIQLEYHPFIPFHFLLALGFGGIAFYSVKHSIVRV